jgi:CBS domain-containing protein
MPGNEQDHFLKLMFFQASEHSGGPQKVPEMPRPGDPYLPLAHALPAAGARYGLPLASSAAPVRLESPATEVMTDLRRVSAVSIEREASIDSANRLMIDRGVRALFVIDDSRQVLGLITSTDVLGERPIQFSRARGVRHNEVAVGDIMTAADRLEALDFRQVLVSRVGDVVATLRLTGRQHALALEAGEGPAGT